MGWRHARYLMAAIISISGVQTQAQVRCGVCCPPCTGEGGTASLRVGTQNKTTDPRFCVTTALSYCPCWFTSPCFQGIKGQPIVISVVTVVVPPLAGFFSYPNRIPLITSTKTTIMANPGCFPGTRQVKKNYCPDREGPLLQPLLRVLGSAVTATIFLSIDRVHSNNRFAVGNQNQVKCPPPLPGAHPATILSLTFGMETQVGETKPRWQQNRAGIGVNALQAIRLL